MQFKQLNNWDDLVKYSCPLNNTVWTAQVHLYVGFINNYIENLFGDMWKFEETFFSLTYCKSTV